MQPISRHNNFDFLRLLLATMVIVSHSYHITGNYENEFLLKATNGQIDLGALAVKGFFTISGFLVFQSLERSPSFRNYFWKRILRLYPALLLLIVVVMLMVPFVYLSDIPLSKNISYWLFGPKVLSLFQFKIYIDGVFYSLPMKEIDVSLWTLPYEFSAYLLLGVLFFIKSKNLRFYLLLASFLILTYLSCFRYLWLNERVFGHFNLFSYYFYDLVCFFVAGALMSYVNVKDLKFNNITIIVCILLSIISLVFFKFYIAKYFLLPIIVILFGIKSTHPINRISETLGDISYGVYIYGFFVQQCLFYFFELGIWELTLVAIPITYMFGWISWNLVEKRALKFKNHFK